MTSSDGTDCSGQALRSGTPVAPENPYRYSLTTRLKEKWILRFLDPRPGERVLDVGCGLGYFVSLMNQHSVRPYGVDVSVESVSLASRQTLGYYATCTADALPFGDNSFDKILFTDVIEHLENDEGAVAEIARVARNGARVVVTTAPMEGLLTGTRLNLLCHDIPGTPEYHVRPGYRTDELAGLLGKHHIKVRQVAYTTVLLGELFIEGMKAVYALKNRNFHSQADLAEMSGSVVFLIYRSLVFPLMYAISKIEEKLLARFLKGHIVIVDGLVCKN
jgi:SAM-dependent methyltransferase